MITANGYSKDPSIMAEGIAVTFGHEMIKEQGGLLHFLRFFHQIMEESLQDAEASHWLHKCSNLPTIEVDHVYIIACNRLYGRVFNGGYRLHNPYAGITDEMDDDHQPPSCVTADGREKGIDFNHIILSGPFERCPHKRILKGFQGFRYTTKLF